MIPRGGTGLSDQALQRWAQATSGFVLLVIVVSTAVELSGSTRATWGASGKLSGLAFTGMAALFPLVGLLIIRRQPRNRIGWLLLFIGVAWGISGALEAYVRWALITHPGSLPGGLEVQAMAAGSWVPPVALMGIYLILLFPDGRLPSQRWRPFAWLAAVVTAVGTVGIVFTPGKMDDVPVPGPENPLGVDSLRIVLEAALVITLPLLPVGIAVSAWSLVRRFRQSHGVERLQLKWLAAAGAVVAAAFVLSTASSLPSALETETGEFEAWVVALQTVSIMSFGLIPIAIGIAVTRHGLYGIDAIINRALVFGVLAVFITGVYIAIVVGIGEAIGQGQRSVGLSVVATAVVAVAFQPVRERVQRVANRLVYGASATPYEVLTDFATRLAGTYTTAELLPRLAELVGQCLRGARVQVWLVDGPRLVREVSWPDDGDGVPAEMPVGNLTSVQEHKSAAPVDRQVAVVHQGDVLGAITVTKPAGEPLTPSEDELLGHVASQAGLVLRNVRLIEDLRSSAERLVTSQDVERRRLERNLHDGAQQSLVSVALLLRMALARVGDDPDGIAPTMKEASVQLQQAIDELRELARGISPAILTERGLGPAVTSLAERSAVPVHVDVSLVHRPPATVERTVYFVVAEALTNVAKYAQASQTWVKVEHDSGVVVAVVADDGIGGADPARGSGLRGLSDRAAAVDGSLDVSSPPGEGTRITCRVPVTAARAAVLEPVS